jgi:transaldolase
VQAPYQIKTPGSIPDSAPRTATRELLTSGTLKHYIDELSVTGLTSNPTIFDPAIKQGSAYDESIRRQFGRGKSGEALSWFEVGA